VSIPKHYLNIISTQCYDSPSFQPWHANTLMIGASALKDHEDNIKTFEPHLVNYQYEGRTNWGEEKKWGGVEYVIKSTEYANVYKEGYKRNFADLLATVGGASGFLIANLGILVVLGEFVLARKRRKKGKDEDGNAESEVDVEGCGACCM
jgi:hypothetical protein